MTEHTFYTSFSALGALLTLSGLLGIVDVLQVSIICNVVPGTHDIVGITKHARTHS